MYEVYDALLNRGYTEKIEKRKAKKESKNAAKRKADIQNGTAGSMYSGNELTSSFDMPMPQQGEMPKPPSQPGYKDYSDKTVPLNQPPTVQETGQTTLLNSNDANEDFTVTKTLHYSSTSETIH